MAWAAWEAWEEWEVSPEEEEASQVDEAEEWEVSQVENQEAWEVSQALLFETVSLRIVATTLLLFLHVNSPPSSSNKLSSIYFHSK